MTEETRKAPSTIREYLDESKESIKVYSWVWDEMINATAKKYTKWMIAIVVCANVLTLTMPFIVGFAIDELIVKNMVYVWWSIVAIALVMLLGRGVLSYYFMRVREIVLGEFLISLDERSNEMFFGKSLGQHLAESEELSAANVEKGRGRILELETMMMFNGIESLISLTIAFTFLFILSWIAGIIMLVALLVYMGSSVFLNQKVADVCIPLDREFRKLNRHRVERWDQIERVKTNAKEKEEHSFMDQWFIRIIKDDRAFWLWFIKIANWRGLVHVFAMVGVLAYGVRAVEIGIFGVGVLVPLFQWSRMVSDNMWQVGHIEHRLNWNMPAVRSMMRALTIPPDVVEKEDAHELPKNGPLAVSFKGISYSYPESKKTKKAKKKNLAVLKNVSFDVRKGEVVALLGRSGAGKSTIMRLLQRSMDPHAGDIEVNGINLKDLKMESFLKQTGYIAQQPAVLDGTLRYNLLYGLSPEQREEITDEYLWDVMRKLEVDFGDRLTDGLDTLVGRRGVKLSGGEAQRVMIASAVLKQPRFMIIDEATSSLDSTTEKSVQAGLEEVLSGDMSALVIAHRLSTVRHLCDKFVVLKPMDELKNGDSQVEAIGESFEELWEISPTFKLLATDQGIIVN